MPPPLPTTTTTSEKRIRPGTSAAPHYRLRRFLFLAPWIVLVAEKLFDQVRLASRCSSSSFDAATEAGGGGFAAPFPAEEASASTAATAGGRKRLVLSEVVSSDEGVVCPRLPGETEDDAMVVVKDARLPEELTHFAEEVGGDGRFVRRRRRIPRQIHQSSATRCLTPTMASFAAKWSNFQNHSYYLHVDRAVDDLLDQPWPEFPGLHEIVNACITSKTTKGDLWRYLVLWEYGGIYSDLDSIPKRNRIPRGWSQPFHEETITADTDAYFVVEFDGVLSQYFMATSPRHPLMYYAVKHSLSNLMKEADTGRVNSAFVTGPKGSLHQAFLTFLGGTNHTIRPPRAKNVVAGTYVGTGNRTVTVEGSRLNSNGLILREAIVRMDKRVEYKRMNMSHFHEDMEKRTGLSCLEALLRRRSTKIEKDDVGSPSFP